MYNKVFCVIIIRYCVTSLASHSDTSRNQPHTRTWCQFKYGINSDCYIKYRLMILNTKFSINYSHYIFIFQNAANHNGAGNMFVSKVLERDLNFFNVKIFSRKFILQHQRIIFHSHPQTIRFYFSIF